MRKLLIITLIIPAFCFAQKKLPRLEGDTLYTTNGSKIYIGQAIQLTNGTENNGNFRFIRNGWGTEGIHFTNTLVTIKEFKKFVITGLNNAYIYVKISATYKDGSKAGGELKILFDKALERNNGNPPEIVLPGEPAAK
jgi:hypothetical protein